MNLLQAKNALRKEISHVKSYDHIRITRLLKSSYLEVGVRIDLQEDPVYSTYPRTYCGYVVLINFVTPEGEIIEY